jgi:hypothetical protein
MRVRGFLGVYRVYYAMFVKNLIHCGCDTVCKCVVVGMCLVDVVCPGYVVDVTWW